MSKRARTTAARDVLTPGQIRERYELHSQRSTAVNQALVKLGALDDSIRHAPEWEEALRVNLLSMWLHQVLSFEEAIGSFLGCARAAVPRVALPETKSKREARAARLWPSSGSAKKIYLGIAEIGVRWAISSDAQFKHELSIAPRHYEWRDAWAHQGGRLSEDDGSAYQHFSENKALIMREGAAWPLDRAWQEARACFRTLVEMFVSAAPG